VTTGRATGKELLRVTISDRMQVGSLCEVFVEDARERSRNGRRMDPEGKIWTVWCEKDVGGAMRAMVAIGWA
jgi:hypothetical protein